MRHQIRRPFSSKNMSSTERQFKEKQLGIKHMPFSDRPTVDLGCENVQVQNFDPKAYF